MSETTKGPSRRQLPPARPAPKKGLPLPGPAGAKPSAAPKPPATGGLTYRDAGVDIDAKMRALQRVRLIARGTFRKGVLTDIGSFGGLFELAAAGPHRNPVLVSSTDGVGTKLKIAMQTRNHRTIGTDLVNHCINDILVQGAVPLFFLDYIAMGKLAPELMLDVVTGLARGCRDAGCALIGGETAEMPDLYRAGDYDLAGFIVGVVEKEHVIDGSRIAAGDILIGLPSSGLHTNGYSLARKIFFERRSLKTDSVLPELGRSVGEELLQVHRSYLPVLRGLIPTGAIYGMAHITGGGFTDNIPRILPRGVSARLDLGSWPVPPVFQYLQREGRVAEDEMLRTFNMGIGMVLVVPLHRETEVLRHLDAVREKHFRIGEIVRGSRKVIYNRESAVAGAPAPAPTDGRPAPASGVGRRDEPRG
ncbi:MAG TPA: phosphoribosylformylglycinamidine cyclo-ligase [Candidatus Polarisedimenticolia bacterium]|nr:phosphoribosylformylglycinamidine cyclo-ligase [Candidatus Polarisedimenticolia bacterium]